MNTNRRGFLKQCALTNAVALGKPSEILGARTDTREWLVGGLAPDAWCGQLFVADHEDIFAFRFLSLQGAWMSAYRDGNRAHFFGRQLKTWWKNWADWWRVVGPKAFDALLRPRIPSDVSGGDRPSGHARRSPRHP